jgi:hypothetical protein
MDICGRHQPRDVGIACVAYQGVRFVIRNVGFSIASGDENFELKCEQLKRRGTRLRRFGFESGPLAKHTLGLAGGADNVVK